MEKWNKRDKKLNNRRALKSIRKAMGDSEPRRKKDRYKSDYDLEWEFKKALQEDQ